MDFCGRPYSTTCVPRTLRGASRARRASHNTSSGATNEGRKAAIDFTSHRLLVRIGGRGEIRTRERREALPVFKTGAFNRSATLPRGARIVAETCAPDDPAP